MYRYVSQQPTTYLEERLQAPLRCGAQINEMARQVRLPYRRIVARWHFVPFVASKSLLPAQSK
jgi:hypothetical protein